MNMLSGIYYPDAGQIYVNDRPVTIASPKDAYDLGIGMIHQHFKLVDVFTATENIVLGLEEPGRMNLKAARQRITEICEKYGFEIDLDQKIYDMSVSEKQTVEIVKVLYRGADILILDEPTAVLTPQETDRLFDILRAMKADGKAIVIITHKLHEVMAISDKVAVLRKGKYVGTVNTADTDPQKLTDMMVGHAVTLNIDRPEPVNVQLRLAVEGLTVYDSLGVKRLSDVSFTAKPARSWASPALPAPASGSCWRPSPASTPSPAAASASIPPGRTAAPAGSWWAWIPRPSAGAASPWPSCRRTAWAWAWWVPWA